MKCGRCHFDGTDFHGDPWVLIENLEGEKTDRWICPSCGYVTEEQNKEGCKRKGRGWIGEPNVVRTKIRRKRTPLKKGVQINEKMS